MYRLAYTLLLCATIFLAPARAQSETISIPPAGEGTSRIAVLGCLRQSEPAPALPIYARMAPDLAIWVGDNIYADTEDDPAVIAACYETLASLPGFAELRRIAPYVATWDDHDFGNNNEDGSYAIKEESRHLFRSFWKLEPEIPEDRDGIYYAQDLSFHGHSLRVVLLDVRYNRDAPGLDADMLGEQQWRWLEETLAPDAQEGEMPLLGQPSGPDLTIIVSGTQFLLPEATGSETWDAYPRAQQRLVDTIRRSHTERVVLLTGDQHYAEVGRRRSGLDFDLVEFQFAGINQIEDPEYNPYRVTPRTRARDSAAFLDIQWEDSSEDPAHMVFRVLDTVTGQYEIAYRVNFSELTLPIRVGGAREFIATQEVALSSSFPNLDVYYGFADDRNDGAMPWKRYTAPLTIDESTDLVVALFDRSGWQRSAAYRWTTHRVRPLPPVSPPATVPGLLVRYHEGAFRRLPTFENLESVPEVPVAGPDLDLIETREDGYALLFRGYLDVPETGMYRFALRSDDGSRLILRGDELINNDGSHSARTREGRIALEAGLHPIAIEYFEDYMGQELELSWYGPGRIAGPIPFDRYRY